MTRVTDEVMQYPFAPDTALDVDPYFEALQRQGPVRIQMAFGPPCWLATRYDDVRTIFCDRRFSRMLPPGTEAPGVWHGASAIDPSVPLGMDPPQHTRLRRITSPVFSPRSIRGLTDRIQGHVDGLLDGMVAQGRGTDFVEAYAWDLPILVLTGLLGVPPGHANEFRGWVETTTTMEVSQEDRDQSQLNLVTYIGELIAERRSHQHDDLLAYLVNARDEGERLSEVELLGLVMSLIVGGFETTATQLGSTIYTLMAHRAHWQELVDGRADLLPALDELWRWIPAFRSGTMFVRWATEDIELSDGVVIPVGEAIVPEQSIANRDEAAFPHAWELDFHRVDPRPHLALGFGEHLCMGLHLAKIQVELTVAALVRRFPTLELAIPVTEVQWPAWTFMRTVGALPLTW